jgi:single-strand DNA-binding protein
MSHKIQGIFRSGRVPEARFTQSGQMVVNVSAATERVWFNGDGEKQTETVWVRFTAWGKRAEFINQWVGKASVSTLKHT